MGMAKSGTSSVNLYLIVGKLNEVIFITRKITTAVYTLIINILSFFSSVIFYTRIDATLVMKLNYQNFTTSIKNLY